MKNVRVLDCTLRDGYRIINCDVKDSEIKDIADRLANSKIDIIELGFLRDHRNVCYNGNSTFFTSVEQMAPFIDKSKKNTMYVAFIDYNMFDFDSLKPYDGTSIDGIRFGFTKKDYDEHCDDIFKCAGIIKNKGYKLFIQGVNSLNYSDKELLSLIEFVNDVQPYSFGIVDTYGAMFVDDVTRIYGLIDNNMDKNICINFHSHNNYQLSFSLAQEIIKLSKGSRKIIIDSTLNGIGKIAGNLNTELIVDYMIRKLNYDYEFDNILDIIDDYIYKYALNHKWGYSIPAMMAGVYKAHPNNIIYLTEKFRLETKDISSLLSMIDEEKRQKYDYDNIEKLYVEYIANKIDDSQNIKRLKNIMEGKEIFVLVPGNTLNIYSDKIKDYILNNDVIIISVNFISNYDDAYAFFGNQKKYNKMKKYRADKKTIIVSNIKSDNVNDIAFNYYSLINRGYKYFENSAVMLLNLLKKIEPCKITIAGFDGFNEKAETNYANDFFQNERHISEFKVLNEEISQMLSHIFKSMSGKCEVSMITPSIFTKYLEDV